MTLSIKYHVVRAHVASRGWNVRRLGEACLVQALSSFNDLVKPGGDLRGRNAATQDIACRHRGAVEIAVGILPLNKDSSL